MASVKIDPVTAPIRASIRPPGSKSITNRAIVCAALAAGRSVLSGVLDSEDTTVMIEAWQQLGLHVEHNKADHTLVIDGGGGKTPVMDAELFVANSGTTIRFLTAALAACEGRFRLDGVERMRERPIADLLAALGQLGAQVESLNAQHPNCPPVLLNARGLAGGRATVAGNISSQFLSGLMMAAPMARADVELQVEGELVSVPYVAMTAEVMRAFGAEIHGNEQGPFTISAAKKYRGAQYAIEPDASAASYFWAAGALTGGAATVEGLSRRSLQGDVRFCECLAQMGCKVEYGSDSITVQGGKLKGIDVDMSDISDTVQTLAAVAMFAEGPTTVHGVAHNRVKETDRISDLATELRKLGAVVDEFPDGLAIHPPREVIPCEIETYRDHRMAMSLALVSLRCSGLTILDPGCTAKTYPHYWEDLALFAGCRVRRFD
ncbi:MAG: 3-phosphoshikimate 1-carboxyvinyltransferase [Pirellulaceae bacterium]|nr:3-phosphoshikimate 1-carboxyvinyltransferase [Pirellulaceae bacterium]